MRRLFSVSLAIVMASLLVGCSCNDKNNSKQQESTVNFVKGESLFGSKIREYKEACKSNKTKDIKNKQKLSTGFGEVAKEKNLPKRIGYTFADLNGDGTEELLVSLVDMKDKLNNYVIAVYQYTEDGIKRLLEGWSRNNYYLMKGNYILNEASGGADDAEISKLHMREGGFEYVSALAMKYNKKNKINYLYAQVGKPENTKEFIITKKQWQEICKNWEDDVDVNNVKLVKDFK